MKDVSTNLLEKISPKSGKMSDEALQAKIDLESTVFIESTFGFLKQQGGLRPRKVHLLIGRSDRGKTTFTMSMIRDAIIKGSKVYLILSEQDIDDIRVPINKFVRKYFPPEEQQEILDRLIINSELDWSELQLDQTKFLSVLKRNIIAEKPDVIILDNLTTSRQYNDKIPDEQSGFADALKGFIRDPGMPAAALVLVLHTGATERNNEWFSDLEAVRGNKTIGNLADFSWSIQKFERQMELSNGIPYVYYLSILKIDKFRRGGVKEQKYYYLRYDPDYAMYIKDLPFPEKLIRGMLKTQIKKGESPNQWIDDIQKYLEAYARTEAFNEKHKKSTQDEINADKFLEEIKDLVG